MVKFVCHWIKGWKVERVLSCNIKCSISWLNGGESYNLQSVKWSWSVYGFENCFWSLCSSWTLWICLGVINGKHSAANVITGLMMLNSDATSFFIDPYSWHHQFINFLNKEQSVSFLTNLNVDTRDWGCAQPGLTEVRSKALTAGTMKVTAFWDVTSYSWVWRYQYVWGTCCSWIYLEVGGSKFFLNIYI